MTSDDVVQFDPSLPSAARAAIAAARAAQDTPLREGLWEERRLAQVATATRRVLRVRR
jgi:hypothetical protein